MKESRRLAPYAVAIGGAIVITAAIELIMSLAPVAGLSAIYLLLVLWLGARWGRGPAVAGSVAAFLLYDFFFVPPVGTFTVAGTAQLLELVVLLAVALVTSQLAASLRRARASAETLTRESRALYELAIAALRSTDVVVAAAMLCRRAVELRSVSRFALVAVDAGQPALHAGKPVTHTTLLRQVWGRLRDRRQIQHPVCGSADPQEAGRRPGEPALHRQ